MNNKHVQKLHSSSHQHRNVVKSRLKTEQIKSIQEPKKENSNQSSDDVECNEGDNLLAQESDVGNDLKDIKRELSKKRWLVLFIFSMITLSNAAIWITLGSISDIATVYYKVGYHMINWFSMSYLLIYATMSLPASIFLSKYGLKSCILVAAILDSVGSCLRYVGSERNRFLFVASGQAFAAFAYAFIFQVPPKLAAMWFGEGERATATSIGVLMNIVGVSVGFIQSTLLVKDSKDMDIVGDGMNILMLSQACFCIACVLMVVLFVDEKPKVPPTRSEALRDEKLSHSLHLSLKESCAILFKSNSFNLTSQAYGIMFCLMVSTSTLLNQTVKSKYKSVSDLSIGLLGFTATLLGAFFTLLTGIFLDSFPKYKQASIVLYLITISSMLGFALVLLYLQNFAVLFTMYCLLNIGAIPFLSSGLEQISEITYPVDEDISCVFPLIFGNFYGFLAIYGLGWLIDSNLVQLAYGILLSMAVIGLAFSAITKVPLIRSGTDSEIQEKVHNLTGD